MTSMPTRRALLSCIVAVTWLLILTSVNIEAGGTLKWTALYAIPVVLAAWHSLRFGFVFAGLGAMSAWIGGALPHPIEMQAHGIGLMWAFVKLSAVALGTRIVIGK